MADKPARALVIYGDGAMPAVTPQHEHLHRLAATGSCGFLALRTLPPTGVDREAFELAQLLDLVDSSDSSLPTMAERFMGLKSTFLSTSTEPSPLGAKFGAASQLQPDSSDPAAVASNLLGLLGFTEESAKETPNELVFVHVTGSDPTLVNDLVGSVLDSSKEGSLAYGRLFLVVVLGYGDARGLENVPSFQQESELPELRPRQSYTMKAGKPVEGIREDYPLLAVYHQVAVTRRDHVQQFEFEEFRKRAGNLVMLADRFLYEVAFKLWKAPKYGA